MKKGFATVYIVMILASLMLALFVIIEAASGYGAESIVKDAVYTTGRSLLAEYNSDLYERYGIFAFQADERKMQEKARSYFDYDFDTSKTVIRLRNSKLLIDTSAYPALDVNVFGKQIEKISAVALKNLGGRPSSENAVLVHPTIPDEILPSRLLGFKSRESVLLSGGITDFSFGTAAEDEYILAVCSDHLRQLGNTYLSNEIEYILFGYKTDEDNLASMRRSIYAFRYAKDLASYGTLPVDPAGLAIELAAIALQAESETDRIAEGETVDEMNYNAFLRAFLILLDREEKLARLMDIMQINVHHIDGSGFTFADHAYGFDMQAEFLKRVVSAKFLGMDRRYKTVEESFVYQ